MYLYIYFSAFIYIYSLHTFAMHCVALLLHMYLAITLHASAYAFSAALHCMPLHMHFPMHCIAYVLLNALHALEYY